MESLIIYSLLSTAMYYLGSRAIITRRLWLAYPPAVARFADCPACIGTWYGLGLSMSVGWYYDLDVFMFKAHDWATPIVVAFCMMVLVPMVAGLMQHSLNVVGTAVPDDHEPESIIAPGSGTADHSPVSPSK